MLNLIQKYENNSLIYKATLNGSRAEDFHAKCDMKGATLTIVKSEMGRVFGGFTDISWELDSGNFKEGNGNSFIFSVRDDQNIVKLKCLKKEKEVYHKQQFLSSFGGTCGFRLYSDCNKNS